VRAPAFTPEWLTYEVSQALAGIGGEHVAKKEATVLRLAEALANGVSMNSVFERPDTCSKRVWYGSASSPTGGSAGSASSPTGGSAGSASSPTGGSAARLSSPNVSSPTGGRGWRDDPAITTALALATERARWWVRVKRGRAVESALEILVDGAEAAALQLTNLVRYGYVKFDYGPNGVDGSEIRGGDVREVLAAAQDLLDRVSDLTAGKGGVTHTLNSDQFGVLLKQAKVDTAVLVADAEGGWDEDSPAPTFG